MNRKTLIMGNNESASLTLKDESSPTARTQSLSGAVHSDDNKQTTKFVTCQDRISQNYPFADFSSSSQTAAFFLSKGSLYSGAQFIWHCF